MLCFVSCGCPGEAKRMHKEHFCTTETPQKITEISRKYHGKSRKITENHGKSRKGFFRPITEIVESLVNGQQTALCTTDGHLVGHWNWVKKGGWGGYATPLVPMPHGHCHKRLPCCANLPIFPRWPRRHSNCGVPIRRTTPPRPLCNSYALVIATVGVGTVLIWYLSA